MKGIEYFYDKKGEPKAVLINLKKHGELWEDFQDLLTAEERRKEPRIPFVEVENELRNQKVIQIRV